MGSEERREMKRVGKEVCQESQERSVCEISGSKAVSRKGCQDSEMIGANRIERNWQHQKRKPKERNVRKKGRPDKQHATGRAVKIQKCQGQTRSNKSGIIRQ